LEEEVGYFYAYSLIEYYSKRTYEEIMEGKGRKERDLFLWDTDRDGSGSSYIKYEILNP